MIHAPTLRVSPADLLGGRSYTWECACGEADPKVYGDQQVAVAVYLTHVVEATAGQTALLTEPAPAFSTDVTWIQLLVDWLRNPEPGLELDLQGENVPAKLRIVLDGAHAAATRLPEVIDETVRLRREVTTLSGALGHAEHERDRMRAAIADIGTTGAWHTVADVWPQLRDAAGFKAGVDPHDQLEGPRQPADPDTMIGVTGIPVPATAVAVERELRDRGWGAWDNSTPGGDTYADGFAAGLAEAHSIFLRHYPDIKLVPADAEPVPDPEYAAAVGQAERDLTRAADDDAPVLRWAEPPPPTAAAWKSTHHSDLNPGDTVWIHGIARSLLDEPLGAEHTWVDDIPHTRLRWHQGTSLLRGTDRVLRLITS